MNDFDCKSEIDSLSKRFCSKIHSKKRRLDAEKEFASHIEDKMNRYMLSGMSEREAFRAVNADLGDPSGISGLLGGIHNNLFIYDLKRLLITVMKFLILWILLYSFQSYSGRNVLYVVFILLFFGSLIWRSVYAVISRVTFLIRLKRICRKRGFRCVLLSDFRSDRSSYNVSCRKC